MYKKSPSIKKCLTEAIDLWLNPRVYTESSYLRFIKGFKYQVPEDFIIVVEDFKPSYNIIDEFCEFYTDGTLLIKKGFAWDGASGPTFDTKDSYIPSIVHDVFYRFIRKGYLPLSFKPEADRIFHKLLLEGGMSRMKAYRWYLGVKWFGKDACTKPQRIVQILKI